MQSKDQISLFPVPLTRWERYSELKRNLGRGSGREVLPVGKDDKKNTKSVINPLKGKTKNGWHFEQGVYDEKGIARSVKAGGGSGNIPKIYQVNQPKHSNDRVYSEEGISPTLNTMQGGQRAPFVAPVLTPDRKNKRQNGRRFKEDGEPAFTLTAQDRHGVYNGARIRKLSPSECCRLQAFPDSWCDVGINEKGEEVLISNTQKYKALGNAVTTSVIKAIINKMYE